MHWFESNMLYVYTPQLENCVIHLNIPRGRLRFGLILHQPKVVYVSRGGSDVDVDEARSRLLTRIPEWKRVLQYVDAWKKILNYYRYLL
jgi:hypothetical protein